MNRCWGDHRSTCDLTRVTALVAVLVMAATGIASARTGHAGRVAVAAASANPLVGTWQRTTTCTELSQVLRRAGLKKYVLDAVAGNGFVPGVAAVSDIADPAHPCRGAVSRRHSHFFTADGQFGSRDWQGQQVDDGTYRIIDNRTLVILKEFPKVIFHYRVRGNTLSLDPVLPKRCAAFRCAWAVSMSYPGHTFKRA
jgi:hypothetical protein